MENGKSGEKSEIRPQETVQDTITETQGKTTNTMDKQEETKQEILRVTSGVDIWVLNLQISRQTSSLTGAQDAETSVY